ECHDGSNPLGEFSGEIQRDIATHAVAEQRRALDVVRRHESTNLFRKSLDTIWTIDRSVAVSLELDDVDVERIAQQRNQWRQLRCRPQRAVNGNESFHDWSVRVDVGLRFALTPPPCRSYACRQSPARRSAPGNQHRKKRLSPTTSSRNSRDSDIPV